MTKTKTKSDFEEIKSHDYITDVVINDQNQEIAEIDLNHCTIIIFEDLSLYVQQDLCRIFIKQFESAGEIIRLLNLMIK